LFILGKVEFGVISQSAMAFGHLIGAFSLIVAQFQAISAYSAVISRLGALLDAMQEAAQPISPAITYRQDPGQLAFRGLTLTSPRSERRLVTDLSVAIPARTHLLIRIVDDSARTALLRATAGLWEWAEGEITGPEPANLLFVPERPYVAPGTLREVLSPGAAVAPPAGQSTAATAVSTPIATDARRFGDEEILDCLRQLSLVAAIEERSGGLDSEKNWSEFMSLGEQQTLAFARVLLAQPRFVVLDHPTRSLNEGQITELLCRLREHGITYVTLVEEEDDQLLYDQLLTIHRDGHWTLVEVPGKGPSRVALDTWRSRL
jgi:vitamin B12/bleomycin/antimicrobial peptide transport system ATP-binding/permease protein